MMDRAENAVAQALLAPSAADFRRPPLMTTTEGKTRQVGVEIEFADLPAEAAVRAVAAGLGGEIELCDPHAFRLLGSKIGDVRVELDSRYAHADTARDLLGAVGATLAPLLGAAAGFVVPCEFIAIVPIDRLHEIDAAVAILRDAGAKGTQDSAIYAFGLHLNPEIAGPDPVAIASVLKAFVLMNAWLRRQVAPDPTRALLGFADPFPAAYVRRIVAPDYQPDLDSLVDDYLIHNPTRNRDLDALPLLAFLRPDRVRAELPAQKIRRRPTYHYRLPDARVSDAGWSIAPDWNRWVAVERLASDRERLEALGRAYLVFRGETKSWADVAERVALA